MRFVTILLLLIFTLPAQAQAPVNAKSGTVTIECPPMYVRKVGFSPNLWLTDRINCTGTITFSDGTTLLIPNVIAETYVRRARGGTWVDACQAIGTAIDNSTLTLNLPREQVVFNRLGSWTALPIHATGELRTPAGKLYAIEMSYPACRVALQGSGLRLAEAITVTGTVRFIDEGTLP